MIGNYSDQKRIYYANNRYQGICFVACHFQMRTSSQQSKSSGSGRSSSSLDGIKRICFYLVKIVLDLAYKILKNFGGQEGSRTLNPFRATDFKSVVYSQFHHLAANTKNKKSSGVFSPPDYMVRFYDIGNQIGSEPSTLSSNILYRNGCRSEI